MAEYQVLVSPRAERQLLLHVRFLAKVSRPAAKRLRLGFGKIIDRLEENPWQFPMETDLELPDGVYRKALFEGRYKALFLISGNQVFLDAVVDCRQSVDSMP